MKYKYVATKIHNNSVSDMKIFDTLVEAVDYINVEFKEQNMRGMNDDEIEEFDNELKLHIDDDHDNSYSYSVIPVEI